MKNGLSLASILEDIEKPSEKLAAEKTASATGMSKAASELSAALKRAEESTKTASAKASPIADLEKVASDLASADHEALVKEANMYGAAICDGFVARLSQYETAYSSVGNTKQASAVDAEKIAAEAIRGFTETQQSIKLAAEREYIRGYNETFEHLTKVAQDVYSKGASDAIVLLNELA